MAAKVVFREQEEDIIWEEYNVLLISFKQWVAQTVFALFLILCNTINGNLIKP